MRLLFALFLIPCALAQQRYSSTTGDVVLAAAGSSFTIQQPGTGQKTVQLESLTVYCSVACNISQTQNGTAATATAGTINPLLPNNQTSAATTWTASNVGAGTTVGPLLHLAAGVTVTIDVSKIQFLRSGGTGTNYTGTVSSITGTVNFTFIWSER